MKKENFEAASKLLEEIRSAEHKISRLTHDESCGKIETVAFCFKRANYNLDIGSTVKEKIHDEIDFFIQRLIFIYKKEIERLQEEFDKL